MLRINSRGKVAITLRNAISTVMAVLSSPRCSKRTKRVVHSNSVPTTLLLPGLTMRLLSQCPWTARSVTSAGRSEIITMPGICPDFGLTHCQSRGYDGQFDPNAGNALILGEVRLAPGRRVTDRSCRGSRGSPNHRGIRVGVAVRSY